MLSFCALPGKPATGTVTHWRKTNPEFAGRYIAAREFGIEALAERALDDASLEELPLTLSLDAVLSTLGEYMQKPDHIAKLTPLQFECWSIAIESIPLLMAPEGVPHQPDYTKPEPTLADHMAALEGGRL